MVMWIKVVAYMTGRVCGLHVKLMLGLACRLHITLLERSLSELVYMNIFYVSACRRLKCSEYLQTNSHFHEYTNYTVHIHM
jgi:hypothetical protein